MAKTTFEDLIIPSLFDEIQRIEPYLAKLQQQIGFDDGDFDRILLALSEAATNAVVHGNEEDPDKNVTISTSLEYDTLAIDVKDEGGGFDPSELPDPLKEENLLNEGGRGVFLIGQFADEVTYSENGTRLTMQFNLNRS